MPMRLPSDQHDEGVAQPEAELDAKGAEHPVDRCDVGAAPDPELPGNTSGPRFLGDRLEHLLDLVDIGFRRVHVHVDRGW